MLIYPKTGMDFGSTVAPPHAILTVAARVVKAGYEVPPLGDVARQSGRVHQDQPLFGIDAGRIPARIFHVGPDAFFDLLAGHDQCSIYPPTS